MSNWEEELLTQINQIYKEGVNKLSELISTLGRPVQKEWYDMFLSEIHKVMNEMYQDIEEQKKTMQKSISDLKKHATQLSHDIGIPPPIFSMEKNLQEEETKLKCYVISLEEKLEKKTEEITLLKEREENVCNSLGKVPKITIQKPLPSAQELEKLLLYLEALEDECFIRREKFTTVQAELQELAKEFEYTPVNEFEDMILNENNNQCSFQVTDINLNILNTFSQDLHQYAKNVKNEIESVINRMKTLWNTLDIDSCYCDEYLKSNAGYKKDNIARLKLECEKLETLKKANLEKIIKRLQSQLLDLWDQCHITESQRGDTFTCCFNDNQYTDKWLKLFQEEVSKVSSHYNDNKCLYEKLTKYSESFMRLNELEAPAQGSERLKNRGGQLLQEEKDRNLIKKRIEKLEPQILKLAEEYFNVNNKRFIYEGEPVEEYLKSLHEVREDTRSQSKSTLNAEPNLPKRNLVHSRSNDQSPKRRVIYGQCSKEDSTLLLKQRCLGVKEIKVEKTTKKKNKIGREGSRILTDMNNKLNSKQPENRLEILDNPNQFEMEEHEISSQYINITIRRGKCNPKLLD